jgi:hypothetical protein
MAMASTTYTRSHTDVDETIRLAELWAGRSVTISGIGGTIWVDPITGDNDDKTRAVRTRFETDELVPNAGGGALLVLERAPIELGLPGAVAFRVADTTTTPTCYYLTNILYGDDFRQTTAETLAAIPDLLVDHISLIVDYSVGRPTGESNFEGPGYNYSPMRALPHYGGRPSKLQLFELQSVPGDRNRLGVRSLFGTYWRSQHWDQVVSQSPRMDRDEIWYFSKEATEDHVPGVVVEAT